MRKTNKQYVAVVINPPTTCSFDTANCSSSGCGRDSSNNCPSPPFTSEFFNNLPLLPKLALDSWGDGSLETQYRKKRQRETDQRERKLSTFDGYMPPHSVFDKWRSSLIREREKEEKQNSNEEVAGNDATNHSMPEQKIKRNKKGDNKSSDLPPLPPPKETLTSQDIDELIEVGPSWKKLKLYCAQNNKNWTTIVKDMAQQYNESLVEYYAKQDGNADGNNGKNGHEEKESIRGDDATNLPPLFRIEKDDKSGEAGNNNQDFYICASIGQPKYGFQMMVDPSVSNQVGSDSSSPVPDLRPSLTKCTVLWRGFMNDIEDGQHKVAVAKVLLQPWTGRRHQLRVHLAHVAGFPILGDVAYGGQLNSKSKSKDRGDVCSRMCLHAKELSIPLIGGEKTFVAEDPFVIAKEDGSEDETLLIQ